MASGKTPGNVPVPSRKQFVTETSQKKFSRLRYDERMFAFRPLIACACALLVQPILHAETCWVVYPSPFTSQSYSNVFRIFQANLFVPAEGSSCSDSCQVTNVAVTGGTLLSFTVNPPNLSPSGGLQVWDMVLSRTCDTPLEIFVSSSCDDTVQMAFPPMSPSLVAAPQSPTEGLRFIEGDNITLAVSALCADTYQWQKDGLDLTDDPQITGSQQNTLTISDVTTNDTGFYKLAIANSYGTNVTQDISITVTPALRMTAQKINAETLRLEIRRAGETPFTESDLSNVKIYSSASLDQPFSAWPELSTTGGFANGSLLFDLSLSAAAQFFRAVQTAP